MGNSGSMSGLSGYEEGYHHHPGYHHHHQRYHDAMRGEAAGLSASWMDSYQRDHHTRRGGPRDHEQPQVKVLPDIPGKVAKLRSTNNGNILHAGGTISKNNQALQRSKSISSPTYQQHQQQQPGSFSECDEELELSSLQPPRMLMQRSRTQLNLMGGGRMRNGHAYGHEDDGRDGRGAPERGGRAQPPRYGEPTGPGASAETLNNRKRFGSEPDLRLSLLPRATGPQQEPQMGGGSRHPKTAQSKIMKGKNKKKAPVPPVMEKRDASKDSDRQRIIAYSPLRKPAPDTHTSTLPSSSDGSFNVAATRKLRLFKTRAETKKTPTIAKLPEASDAKFPGKHAQPGSGAPGGGFMRPNGPPIPSSGSSSLVLTHAHRNDCGPTEDEKLAGALEQLSPRPNPTSFFRREKTFDAGLLGLERQREAESRPATKPTMSPPLSRRKSIVKTLLEQDPGTSVTAVPVRVEVKPRQQVGTAAESYQRKMALAEAQRKQSASGAAAITDFQKELQLATRRKTSSPLIEGGPSPAAGRSGQSRSQKVTESASSRFSLLGAPSSGGIKPKPASNALVITVEPAKELEHRDGAKQDAKVDARDSPPPATPPPPPPPPKTSFYFGMRDDVGQGSRRFTGTARTAIGPPFVGEPRIADSESEGNGGVNRRETRPQEPIDGQSVEEIGHTQMELIDQFAASLLNSSRFRSSDSVASSEADVRMTCTGSPWEEGDGVNHQEIALKLRPTLPRKQFDIPRFSPAAAWRLLTTEDEFCRDAPLVEPLGGSGGSPEKKPFMRGLEQELEVPEDRIQQVYREPVPGLQDNKSGDSGISGDAGILADIGQDALLTTPGKDDRVDDASPESGTQLHKGGGGGGGATNGGGWSSSALLLMPWTPQQDLDDDEDDDEDEDDEPEEDETTTGSGSEPQRRQLIEDGAGRGLGDTRQDFASKGHLFSLSLPRENHLSIYNVEAADEKVEKHVFNSLQKFRKSVSGAFKSEDNCDRPMDNSDSNWFLGRLDGKLGSLGGGSSPGSGPDKRLKLLPDGRERDGADVVVSIGTTQSKHSSIGYLVSGKHMMYLPKEPTKLHQPSEKGAKQDENNNSRRSANQQGEKQTIAPVPPVATVPKDPATGRSPGDKENMQDPVPLVAELESFPVKLSNRRNHRFTFQSTIRQIEKRRVAEKLSREAEIKEAMRLSELEAMRRVEEEFQKKRAREKASIRHQLRLFSMEAHPDHHLQPDGDGEQDSTGETKRSDPDGDSLPHQGGTSRAGLYRRKEFTSMERQYKRSNRAEPEEHPDQEEDDHDDEQEQKRVATNGTGARRHFNGNGEEHAADNDEDEDGRSSSLGYVDTRTPYISRIIQAKSSKSYGGRK
ncbi:uncharacterized protein LOC128729157 [Anopheles nili]|uniref:uncharacterized protein LOC128729157 n=1 Tax=Anopheles nili TaxID=185578 RepID=UPI00237AB196|nr:uncharacterized protein LOC128729157 [Anopheles nili]